MPASLSVPVWMLIRRVVGCLFLSSIVLSAYGEKMSQQLYVLPQNCDFVNDDERDCAPQLTPKLGNPFLGVLINGPRSVTWPKNDSPDNYMKDPFGETMEGPFRLYIAVRYRLPHSTLGLNGDFENEILVVAVNQATQQVYRGKLHRSGFSSPRTNDLDPQAIKALEKDIIGGYFKISLLNDIDLPIATATYTVYATLGEYKSNVLTIKTVVK